MTIPNMDISTKIIALKKVKELRRNLNIINQMVIDDEPLEEVSDRLGEQWISIRDLKSLLKAYSISEKINSGRIDEAISEASRIY